MRHTLQREEAGLHLQTGGPHFGFSLVEHLEASHTDQLLLVLQNQEVAGCKLKKSKKLDFFTGPVSSNTSERNQKSQKKQTNQKQQINTAASSPIDFE